MLSRTEEPIDTTGMRWDQHKARWVKEYQPVISITTNTRGSTKMTTKDYSEMSGPELVAAYNKLADVPVKKFKDKATALARLAAITSENATKKAAKKKDDDDAPSKKYISENKLAAEFGAKGNREKLLIALDQNYRKMFPLLDLLKAVYGSKNTENLGALSMVLKGANATIDSKKLPYVIKTDKNAEGEKLIGLYPK